MFQSKEKIIKTKVENCIQYARSPEQFREMMNREGLDIHRFAENLYVAKDSSNNKPYPKIQIPMTFAETFEKKYHKREKTIKFKSQQKLNEKLKIIEQNRLKQEIDKRTQKRLESILQARGLNQDLSLEKNR